VDRLREPLPTRVESTPDLPPAYAAALEAGLATLAIRLTPAARAAIDGHARLLLAWTSAISLTAFRVLRERGVTRFVDLGSGGGYPGLPLATVLPAERALLLEPIAKKAAFLSVAVAATGLDPIVEVAAVRAEALAADPRHRARWPAVSARAVAGLADLVELAFPLVAPGGCLVAWKRGDIRAELAAAERAIDALGGGSIVVIPVDVAGLEGHRLVVASARGRVPAAYPRDPSVRRRRPW
jgi:16S rRNA (guanine527-N7)-methyltransferase